MYNSINPAVIKSILLRLSAKDLVKEIEFMESELEDLPAGNKRTMFLRLRSFAKNQLDKLQSLDAAQYSMFS